MSKSLNPSKHIVYGLILMVMFACGLLAQETRGTVGGRIVDPSGSAMPNVTVEITNTATNTKASTKTNEQGDYLAPYLLAGTYTITANSGGFKTFFRPGIEVHIGDRLQVDITMEIGEQSQRVTVTADTPLLQTATSSVGQVIEQKWITDLPVLHGNQMLLTQLAPGVVSTVSAGGYTWVNTSSGANARNTEYAMAGSPSSTQEISLDGATNTTTVAGNASGKRTIAFVPPADLVSEFKVQTAAFDASIGNSTGGWVATSLKSGTNTVHGTTSYSRTNVGWNANDFFANRAGQQRAVLHSDHEVITGSGPVYLPKIYDGRNKTFFLYGWEREMRSAPFAGSAFTVPTAKEREGDFSDLLKVNSSYQIYNPFSASMVNGRVTRQPFANNIVPQNLFSPAAKKILAYYPAPLVSGLADGTLNYPQPNLLSVVTLKSHTFRIDHNLSERQRLFVRAYYGNRPAVANDNFGNLSTGLTSNFANRGILLDDVYTLSPSLVLGVRYAFTRFFFMIRPKSEGMDLTTLGLPAALVSQIDPAAASFPTINISGLTAIGGNNGNTSYTNTHQFSGELTWVRGQHTVQFGVDHRRYQQNLYNNQGISPTLTFGSTYTMGPADNSTSSPGGVGQGLAAFLLGIPASGSISKTDGYAESSPITSLFVQDNWRIAKKLTLNLGLRYELEGAMTERYDRSVRGFDTTTVNSLNAQVAAAYAQSPLNELPASQFSVKGGLQFAGSGQHTLYDTPKTNFAPRIGLAYQLTDNTVIRGGYGMFYGFIGQQAGASVIQTGFNQATTLVPTVDGGLSFTSSLDNPFPSGLLQPSRSSLGLNTYLGQGVSFFDTNPTTPFNQIWSVTVQRMLARQSYIEIGYIGNHGSDLRMSRALQYFDAKYLSRAAARDQDAINYWTLQVANPFYPLLPGTSLASKVITRNQLAQMANYPQFVGVSTTNNDGESWYNALTARFQKSFASGFTVQVNYTRSKLMQATSRLNGQSSPLERVIGGDDRPYSFTLNSIYEFPFGPGKKFPLHNRAANLIAGGWQVGVIVTEQGGPALGFGNALLTGGVTDVPLSGDQRNIDRWFNTDVFNRNSAQQLSYNYITLSSLLSGVRAPGLDMWNGCLMKNTQIAERLRFQLKADVANMFNHPNFGAPNTSPTSTAFGRITSSGAYSRIIQLGAKVIW